MFIHTSTKGGKKYLSLAVKKKNKAGNWETVDIFRIGSLETLSSVFKNPREFFKNFALTVINYGEESKKGEDDSLHLKQETSMFNLGFLYIKWILEQPGIDTFFERIQKKLAISYNLAEVFFFLIFSQIIDPSSFLKSWRNQSDYIEYTDIPLYDVYRSLDHFAENSEPLQAHIFSRLDIDPDKMKILDFDGTNVWFESEEGDENIENEEGKIIISGLRSHGFSKENHIGPITNLGLLTEQDGLPVAFLIFPGREHEKTHLIPLLNRVRQDYRLVKFTVVADRGNYSGNVISGIMAVDKSLGFQAEKYILGVPVRQADKNLIDWATSPDDFEYYLIGAQRKHSGYVKYKYRRVKKRYTFDNARGEKESFTCEQAQMVYYSHSYAKREKHKRNRKKRQAEKMVEKQSYYNAAKNSGAAGLVKEEHYVKPTGEIAKGQMLKLDEEKIKKQEALDGFYTIVTNNLTLLPMGIKHLYHQLTYIEGDFRILKSVLKLRPVYVRTYNHVLAHFLIEIISLLVLRILKQLLHNQYTIEQITEALRDFNCYQDVSDRYLIPYSNPIVEELKEISGIGFSKKHVLLSEIDGQFNKTGSKVSTMRAA